MRGLSQLSAPSPPTPLPRGARGFRFLSAGPGFFRVDQAVVVGIERLEHVPRSEEFLPGQVAIVVPVHALEPDRADGSPRLNDDSRDRRFSHPARAEQLEAAADHFEVQAARRVGRPDDRLPGLAQCPQRGRGVRISRTPIRPSRLRSSASKKPWPRS